MGQYVPSAGNLVFFSETQDPFYLYLNGEIQNNQPKPVIRIENLNQRFYSVKIIFENKALREINKNYISAVSRDGITFEEATYKITVNQKSKKTKIKYFSGTPIIPDSLPEDQNVLVLETQNPPVQNNGTNIYININTKESSSHDPTRNPNNPNNRPRYIREMGERDFQRAKNNLSKESFDDTKIALTQNILLNNYLNTKQIAEIANTFTFDKNQMAFVKQAYSRCVDVKNYYIIKDTFTFDSDRKELIRFINNQ